MTPLVVLWLVLGVSGGDATAATVKRVTQEAETSSPPREGQTRDLAIAGFVCDQDGKRIVDGRAFIVRDGRILSSVPVDADGWFGSALSAEHSGKLVTLNVAGAGRRDVLSRDLVAQVPFTPATTCQSTALGDSTRRSGPSFLRFHVSDAFAARPVHDAAVSVRFEYGETLATVTDETGFATLAYSPTAFSGRQSSWRVTRPGYRDEAGALRVDAASPDFVRVELLPNALVVPVAELLENRHRLPDAPAYIVTDRRKGVRTVTSRWEGGRQEASVDGLAWKVLLPASAVRSDTHLVFDVVAPMSALTGSRAASERTEAALAKLVRSNSEISGTTIRAQLADAVSRSSERLLFSAPFKATVSSPGEGRPSKGPVGFESIMKCLNIDPALAPRQPVPADIALAFEGNGMPLRADARMTPMDGGGGWIIADEEDGTGWQFRLIPTPDGTDVFLIAPVTLVDGPELERYLAQATNLLKAARMTTSDAGGEARSRGTDALIHDASIGAEPLLTRYTIGQRARGDPATHWKLSIPVNAGVAYGHSGLTMPFFVGAGIEWYPQGTRAVSMLRVFGHGSFRRAPEVFAWGMFLHPAGLSFGVGNSETQPVTRFSARSGFLLTFFGTLQLAAGGEVTYERTPAWLGVVSIGYAVY